jgi:RNA polymerase sigma-70 factor (ECF subfamily)
MNCLDQDVPLALTNGPRVDLRDTELLSAVLSGSPDAFAELQRLYSRRLYSTIFRIIKNREDAEDVLQDAFLQAYLALRNFQGRSSVYSWLTRIAINSALMLLRKRRNHPEVYFDLSSEPDGDVPHLEPKDPCLNPEQVCDQLQRCANIHREIERLQANLREPLQTRMTHGSYGSRGESAALSRPDAAQRNTNLQENGRETARSIPFTAQTGCVRKREQPCVNFTSCL